MADVQALKQALGGQPGVRLVELPQADVALLLGLPGQAGAKDQQHDAQCRAQLMAAGMPWQVLHAPNGDLLTAALWALGLPQGDEGAREHLQSGLAGGRVPWVCGQCSDPDCEHRLFQRLLRGQSPQG